MMYLIVLENVDLNNILLLWVINQKGHDEYKCFVCNDMFSYVTIILFQSK